VFCPLFVRAEYKGSRDIEESQMGGDELREKGPTVSQFTKIPKFYIFAAITLLYTLYTVSQKMSQP